MLEVATGCWLGWLSRLFEGLGRVSEEGSVCGSLCAARCDLMEGVLGCCALLIEPPTQKVKCKFSDALL